MVSWQGELAMDHVALVDDAEPWLGLTTEEVTSGTTQFSNLVIINAKLV